MQSLVDDSESESTMSNTRNQVQHVNIRESGSSNGVVVLPNDNDTSNDAIDAGDLLYVVSSHDETIETMAKRGTWKQTDWLALAKEFKDNADDYKATIGSV